ncbi:pyridoxamine 5'-phosphate oxidase family protein [Natrialba swarupiae]|uniref:Pyridoxamine 5'-phosphate oxidase family protein n=1 Tax=Natrialba swarupiae TaxID=2448032 RepID=A0A5D5AQH5_9EURY|nr:pyridoxamine 5'-phosphate oxidase family protein [Natrialba swarupiae]TYT61291.1 pyridoxamine 5'-phosphate oxidase family protein [Natrialba swarupiae]
MTVDDLAEYGMERMDDDDIVSFLSTRSFGVLGLSAEETPYLIPMSYGFDGESRLYFGYVVGSQSRKAELSDRADAASFLVYSVETMFHWQSVLATGTLRALPPDETSNATAVEGPMWRPELLETASEADENQYYELQIEEWTGLRHAIEPPSFMQRSSRDRPE